MSTQLNTYRLFTQLTVVVMAIAFCATGCKKNQKTTLSPIDYSATAEQLFEKASFAFERERWADAEKMFSEVRRQYPYSRFASTAEIRSADCLFSQGSLAEAAVAYQHFLKTYPTHPEAPFAAFRRSVAYFKQIPGDFFIMPPSHERDRSATRDARAAIAFFLTSHPDSEWVPEAREMLVEVENALVRHEMYVAGFYLKRNQLKSASVRLDGIGRQYTLSPLVPDAMLLQAVTCLRMNDTQRALGIFNDIIELYPEHHQAIRARKYLSELSNTETGKQ